MSNEDELSKLAELEYKEELERKRVKEIETRKILEWEAFQRQKDAADKEARLLRTAELEVTFF